MQSILGALLTAGYATAMATAIAGAPNGSQVSTSTQDQLQQSFASASDVAAQYPKYSTQIKAAAQSSFLDGANWAYTAGIAAILLGAALVFFLFPRHGDEERLIAEYHTEDTMPADVGGVTG
jgi:hypothetical protein